VDSSFEQSRTFDGKRPAGAFTGTILANGSLLWLIPISIFAIEAAIALINPLAGVYGYAMAALLLFGVIGSGDVDMPQTRRNLVYGLLALVIIRMFAAIFWLTPLVRPIQMAVITAASAVAISMAARAAQLRPAPAREVSSGAALALQLTALGVGLLMATIYIMLSQRGFLPQLTPIPAFDDATGRVYASLMLAALFCHGMFEELLFRRVLFLAFEPYVGIGAAALSACVFGVLFVGHLAPGIMIFGFVMSLLFALLAKLSGMTLGVAVAHGVLNVMIALLGPHLTLPQGLMLAYAAFALTAAASLIALWLVSRHARQVQLELSAELERMRRERDEKRLLLTAGRVQ
jgi:membrane protease YdiL (CAAX protease family)